MSVFGLLEITLPSQDPPAAQQWWAEHVGLIPNDTSTDVLDAGDVGVRFGSQLSLRFVGSDDAPVRLVDPAGTEVEIVEPDHAAARAAEESIRDFIASAGEDPGPSVDTIVDQVQAAVVAAQSALGAILVGVPNNTRIAVMLALGQRARELEWGPPQVSLHAASSLLGSFVGPDRLG